jgi:hypothetical protein
VRPRDDHRDAGGVRAAGIESWDDEHRLIGLDHEERRSGGEGIGDGPVLKRLLEACEVGKRLGMREDSPLEPLRFEGRPKAIERRRQDSDP